MRRENNTLSSSSRLLSHLNAKVPYLSRRDTAFVLFILAHTPDAEDLGSKLVQKLTSAFSTQSNESRFFDTILSILALYYVDKSNLDGAMTAELAKQLIAHEVNSGGPYCDDDNRIDIGINLVIGQLFSLLGAPLPGVMSFLDKTILQASTYFTKDEMTFLATFPAIITKNPVFIPLELNHPDSLIGRLEEAEQKLVRNEQHTSSRSGLVNDNWSKADAITQARALRLLNLTTVPSPQTLFDMTKSEEISMKVYGELHHLEKHLSRLALKIWEAVKQADRNHEITLLSYDFAKSLLQSPDIDKRHQEMLGIANYYLWMAYTIYDDIIDDDKHPRYLAVANISHRRSLMYFNNVLGPPHTISSLPMLYFDQMDTANAWELRFCRFKVRGRDIFIKQLPDFKDRSILAHRAYGHILGPIIIASCIKNIAPAQLTSLQKGLEHYLIARQLNDDLHDWEKDFKKGHITFVVSYILKRIGQQTGVYNKSKLMSLMRTYIWDSGIEEVGSLTLEHIAKAKAHLKMSGQIADNSPLYIHIERVEMTAQQSIQEHDNESSFLRTYSNG